MRSVFQSYIGKVYIFDWDLFFRYTLDIMDAAQLETMLGTFSSSITIAVESINTASAARADADRESFAAALAALAANNPILTCQQ